jgi:hypothetical protein
MKEKQVQASNLFQKRISNKKITKLWMAPNHQREGKKLFKLFAPFLWLSIFATMKKHNYFISAFHYLKTFT